MSSAVTLESPARRRQEKLGQFLTPEPVADFMASLFGPFPKRVRLLDAGAGAGALTAAVVSHWVQRKHGLRSLEAILYELDPLMGDALAETMQDCQRRCDEAGIQFRFTIHQSDFIEDMTACLTGGLFSAKPPEFEAAIANPPYRKIRADSRERQNLSRIGVETSNLYTGFIAIVQRLLVPGGQLVGITPRSFCNGPYFRSFREDFLANLEIHRLHVFESRGAAFRKDGVLQENIIFHAVKGRQQPEKLVVSSSSGEHGGLVTEGRISFTEIVHESDPEKFIHIPSGSSHADAKKVMAGLEATLDSLGVTVSTGRVVDFRLKGALRMKPERGAVPLLYPCHFNGGTVHWPKMDGRKPNAILNNDETRQWLVKSGVYLLTKRFTSKEEPRRLVACLFDPEGMDAEWLGFENHLNYFHAGGEGLDRNLAAGLFAFLNSTVVDQYFRRFSGHTQVNAADLRNLAYPNRKTLLAMGSELRKMNQSQDEIDKLVEKYLHGHR